MSRTKKKPYTGAKAVDKDCRGHGACPWCRGNRTIQGRRSIEAAKARESDT